MTSQGHRDCQWQSLTSNPEPKHSQPLHGVWAGQAGRGGQPPGRLLAPHL